MIRFYKTSPLLRWYYPSFIWSKESTDSIYLTFDDGPEKDITPWVLQELDKVKAKATFFCLGKNLAENESIIQQMINTGHLVANHGYSHLKGWKTGDEIYLEDVRKCDGELERFGIKNDYFRPPYGKIKKRQADQLRNKKIVMWSHLAWDFDEGSNIQTTLRKLRKAKPGSIITLHDNKKSFKNLKMILPELLHDYNQKGLELKTIDQ